MANATIVSWFDIPAKDINRAVKFYNDVLGINIQVMDFQGMNMAMFTDNPEVTGGAIVEAEHNEPSNNGTTVYFVVDDVASTLDKVEAAGGQIVQPKTQINEEYGYFGLILDSEGNRVGLHSFK